MAKGKKEIRNGRPVAVDLFCGAGGMSLGLEQAGFDVALGVELDGYHVATHERNFPYGATLCRSVADLTGSDIFAALGGASEVDVIVGGPPCQGFSNMGLRDVADPRNTLVRQFARIVTEVRPKAFVMENVPGMLAGATKLVLDDAVAVLGAAGYRITTPVRVVDAGTLGVPQRRKRLILLGLREDIPGELEYPHELPLGQPPRPTVWEAISDLPDVDCREELFRENDTQYDREPTNQYARIMRGLSETPSDFSHPRAWDRNRCTGCLRVRHTDAAIELYTATPAGQVVPGHKLPRLDPEGIAPTLRAGSDSSHGSYTAPRPIHPHRPRCITAREAGRLHGFPDWFSFYPLKWHAYRQIGNAVCPPVAKALGLQVMRALGYTPTKPSRVIELTDEFRLPDERPRTLRRIPQILNYPPVVAHLFAKAFDATTKRLRDSRFSFADVQEAIAKTGVNLSWTRADTFLAEIARSRNVRSILAACLSQGFSIREVTDGTAIGEFVVAGQPEAIDERDFLRVSSREIGGAVALGVDCLVDLNETESLLCLLANPVVRGALWGEPAADIELEPLRGEKGTVAYLYRRLDTPGCAVAFGLGNYPNRVRLARLAKATNRDELVVFVPATNKHVLAARFENCKSAPRERTRAVFAVDGQVPSQKQGKRRTRRDNQPTLF